MNKLSRIGGAAVIGLGLVVAVPQAAIAPMSYTAAVDLTATVMAMGGLGYETIETDLIKRVLGGRYANEEKLVGLPWPGEMTPFNGTLTLDESVAVGVDNMDAAIRATPGPKIVAGASGSTLAVNEMMRRLANDPTAPPKEELSFVVLGDADRGVLRQFRGVTLPLLDHTVQPIPVTQYDVLVVAGEYDGIGDWPDRPWNVLAVINALAGSGLLQQVIHEDIVDALKLEAFGSVHYDTMFADLTQVPEENITTAVNQLGGVTTTYLVPTADLPMLRPLTAMGVPQNVVDGLEMGLRPIVDAGYARNDPFRKPAANIGAPRQPAKTVAAASVAALPAASEPETTTEKPKAARATAAKETGNPAPKRARAATRSND